MNVNFKYTKAANSDKVVFEAIFGEKSGGGIVANPSFDVPIGTAVGPNSSGKLTAIKGYKLTKAVAVEDTAIEIEKGSGVAVGDFIGVNKKAVACSAVDTTGAKVDVVTITLGVAIPKGQVLYQAKGASASSAEPIYKPQYVTGEQVIAGEGDQLIKLVNAANVVKQAANFGAEVCEHFKTINLV